MLSEKEKRLFEMFKEERLKRRHYQGEVRILQGELREVRKNYVELSEKMKRNRLA